MASLLLYYIAAQYTGELARGGTPPFEPPRLQRDPMPKLKKNQVPLNQMITLRVTERTRADWKRRAQASGLPLVDWIREQVSSRTGRRILPRRRPLPSADPALLAAIARVGNNLNQLARAANRQQWPDRLSLLERLISIERALNDLVPSDDV